MGEWVSADELGQGRAQSAPPWDPARDEELWDRVEGVRHKLTRILNPAKLTPYLRQCKVIDEQDEEEVLNSTQYPLRMSKAGRLIDILHGRGQRGLQAFMESLEFYHPEQYTQLTGQKPTQRCSIILDEEGPEGLTQFLLLEVRKLREQLRGTRLCERRLSLRCRVAEDERGRAERKMQELRHERLQLERLRQDWEAGSRELDRLKERHLEQAVKYSRTLEEQAQASARERALLAQVEQLRNKLNEAERQVDKGPTSEPTVKTVSQVVLPASCTPAGQQEAPLHTDTHLRVHNDTQALLEILQQDRKEAAEQRHELCSTIARLQGEVESVESHRDKVQAHCEQLQLKVQTLQLDLETEQKRSMSYFNQIMELEKERDQALRSRDGLQLEYTDCLLDKNQLRKRITELQAAAEQLQRDLEKEKESGRDRSAPCLHCSHLSLVSEEQCYGPCCSLGLSLSEIGGCASPRSDSSHVLLRKTPSSGQRSDRSGGSCYNSEENLLTPMEDSEKDINRLSLFPFPPCVNSINRRCNTEFDMDSWGSDENLSVPSESSLSDSWSSLNSHLFPPDLVNLPPTPIQKPSLSIFGVASLPPSPPPSRARKGSLADDISIAGGNSTGIFVSSVRAGSPAELCGLKEGSELLELEHVLFGGGGVQFEQCTTEVAHFSLQWWTEPSSLKHRLNTGAYSRLCAQQSSPSFSGCDSFYVRVNMDIEPQGDPPCLGVHCDDIVHVTDTFYNGKYQWRCARVDPRTSKPQQAGVIPNYNRAQQLLLVRLRTMALEQKGTKKKFSKKCPVRLVKAVSPSCRGIGSSPQVLYTLSHRHEENLIPYSTVQKVSVASKRPVIFCPSLLSHGLIKQLLQPAESALTFNTCQPEPISAADRKDRRVFPLNPSSSDQAQGVRLESIQEAISQDKHCLLELGLGSVEGLLRQGVYPIVIHIRPKDKKGRKFKKLLSGRSEDGVMEQVCQAEELQLENLPMLHHTVEPSSWSCTEELLGAVCSAIQSQQRAALWVELDRQQ
ncbi:hypothetical protein COCON_G00209590 [Conger conger]|uniref:CARD domain-containing protein n=1 Tax=Conger conger TaxID=82655 RepID=A0A9Q1HPV1_CONCO|nr:hypothetical protein COCON_G00209590 [Conger conger]